MQVKQFNDLGSELLAIVTWSGHQIFLTYTQTIIKEDNVVKKNPFRTLKSDQTTNWELLIHEELLKFWVRVVEG